MSVVLGLGLGWDPRITIQMQNVHGGIARTKGTYNYGSEYWKTVYHGYISERTWTESTRKGGGTKSITTNSTVATQIKTGRHSQGGRESSATKFLNNLWDLSSDQGEVEIALSGYWDAQAEEVVIESNQVKQGTFSDEELADVYVQCCLPTIKKSHPGIAETISLYLNKGVDHQQNRVINPWKEGFRADPTVEDLKETFYQSMTKDIRWKDLHRLTRPYDNTGDLTDQAKDAELSSMTQDLEAAMHHVKLWELKNETIDQHICAYNDVFLPDQPVSVFGS
ncbi:hypothetical protein F5880DRAFT_1510685 [Lentinula raphanica]|nr:hypothetical protein F5880DRAFT_1510685 [Lentinula raphanica]